MNTITTNDVTRKGSIEDAIAQSQDTPAVEAVKRQVGAERRPTKYLVVQVVGERTDEDELLRVIGTYEVSGGQPAARAAAIADNEQLRAAVLAGGEHMPTLAAIANFNPVQPRLENREPKIVA